MEAIVFIEIDLEGAANTGMQDKWAQDCRRKTYAAPINAAGKHRFGAALVQALEFLCGNSQADNDYVQTHPMLKALNDLRM